MIPPGSGQGAYLRCPAALTEHSAPIYAGQMAELPKDYARFLKTLTPQMREALEPIFQQSVAGGEHGVLIRGPKDETQATVSEDVPYGQVRNIQE